MPADENISSALKVKILTALALVFSLGFAAGYTYPGSQGKNSSTLTIEDKSEDCAALFKENAAPEGENAASAASAAGASEGTVLSASDARSAPASQAVKGKFAASKNSTLYHTPDCQYVKRIKAENVIWFGSEQEAAASGKKPHKCTGG
jgi:hypothetical protein